MPPPPGATRTVAVDACVLINVLHLDRLDLLFGTPGFTFVVTATARTEIKDEVQRRRLDAAIASGAVQEVEVEGASAATLEKAFASFLDPGESATLAVAAHHGWTVATDEKHAAAEVRRRLGESRLLNTVGVMIRAIRGGRLSIEEADAFKRRLEARRFRMRFASFRDVA